MTLSFDRSEKDMRAMAVFIAQLVREGVTFTINQDNIAFEIKLTGGF